MSGCMSSKLGRPEVPACRPKVWPVKRKQGVKWSSSKVATDTPASHLPHIPPPAPPLLGLELAGEAGVPSRATTWLKPRMRKAELGLGPAGHEEVLAACG